MMMMIMMMSYLSSVTLRAVSLGLLPLRELAVISCPFITSVVFSLVLFTPFAPKMRPITIITVDVSSIFVNVTHKVSKPFSSCPNIVNEIYEK